VSGVNNGVVFAAGIASRLSIPATGDTSCRVPFETAKLGCRLHKAMQRMGRVRHLDEGLIHEGLR